MIPVAALHTGRAPQVQSRRYVWTTTQIVTARTALQIERVLTAGLPDDVTEELIRGYIQVGLADLAWQRRIKSGRRPVHLVPRARKSAA